MDSFNPQQNNISFNMPPITNPPTHQYFASDGQDTSPMLENFPAEAMFGDSDEHRGSIDESNDAKRRRIARACDMCRKKKIKCDAKMPKCSHCENYKTECIFTHVEKKRAQPKGAKYIESLENRLGRMESLLKLSGLLNEEDGDRTDLGTLEKRLADQTNRNSSPGTPSKSPNSSLNAPTPAQPASDSHHTTPKLGNSATPKSSLTSPEPPKATGKPRRKNGEEEVEALSDMMCSLVTNNCGETRYIGSSSGFSIFSPKGIQWVNEKTGDSSFQEMISSAAVDDNKWVYWKPEIFSDMFARRTYKQLPPRDEALSLLKDYFENFNCMFPLFHEPTFMHLVNKHYTKDPYEGSGWWASLNIALAIAHRLRVMSRLVPQEEDNKAWAYLKNAMGVLTELTMRNTDLLSVQALLGMAMFLLGTPNPQPSFFLVSAALRFSHSIGLHKKGTGFNLNPVELEQRKRVFWIAYILDKDICLRSGRPPAQDDDDMSVELPTEVPSDNIGNIPLADGKGKANLFLLMCTFAIIESRVYKQLYSTKASKQSDGALLNTIGELDKELEDWKDSIPLDFRPEHEIKASHTPLILHIVVLHFAYYNCLTTIHRMSVHHGYWSNRLSEYAISGLNARPLNPRVFSSAALCVTAARASINLVKYIPQGDFSCVWLILYFPVSSLVTLFANILQNPHDARARSDVKLMRQVVDFLSLLSVTEEQGGVRRMLGVCAEFERIARVVLEKSERESKSRSKRRANKGSVSESPKSTPRFTQAQVPQKRPASQMPSQGNAPTPANVFTPDFNSNNLNSQPFNPSLNGFSPNPVPVNGDIPPIPLDFSTPSGSDFANMLNPSGMTPNFQGNNDMQSQQLDGLSGPPFDSESFQQPFVPQDLWQMPMTLEWDWADMTSMGFPSFDGSNQQQPEQQSNGLGQI